MAELVALTVNMKAAVDEEYVRLRVPMAATLVGVSVVGGESTGAPTMGILVVTEETLDEVCAVTIRAAEGWRGDWLSQHFGGAASPVALPAGAGIGVRLYLSGGSNPTLGCTASLWLAL